MLKNIKVRVDIFFEMLHFNQIYKKTCPSSTDITARTVVHRGSLSTCQNMSYKSSSVDNYIETLTI